MPGAKSSDLMTINIKYVTRILTVHSQRSVCGRPKSAKIPTSLYNGVGGGGGGGGGW